MTRLSVNLNKIALLRNQRDLGLPSVTKAAHTVLQAGAAGITVHPRPDQRHTRDQDVHDLRALTQQTGHELNVEGNPQPAFLDLVLACKPDQVTLVPDDPAARTSDHGWDLSSYGAYLSPIITQLQQAGIRVSLFVDHDSDIAPAAAMGADAIELYTEPYAIAFAQNGQSKAIATRCAQTAQQAAKLGLQVHAGHDLNQNNLLFLCQHIVPLAPLHEVSIGHAFTAEALWQGLATTTQRYVAILQQH